MLGSANSSNYGENIRHRRVKFGRPGYPVPGICAPLCKNMSAFSPSSSKLTLHEALPVRVGKIRHYFMFVSCILINSVY